VQYVGSGGKANGTVILAGGHTHISAGGFASGTQISSGGFQNTSGTVTGVTISSGGVQYVAAGGVESSTTVLKGGQDSLLAGGKGVSTTLSSGGVEAVESGSIAVGTTVLSGGHQYVFSGGVASAAVVNSGGIITISSGGTVAAGITLGGVANDYGSIGAGQTVSLTGTAADLKLYNTGGFAAKISGFVLGDTIDLISFGFASSETVSWSQNGTSGTLTVTDGAQIEHLTLIGSYVTSNFTLANDGFGGTAIHDPPVGGGAATTLFAQNAAAMPVHGGMGATTTPISSWTGAATSALIPSGATSGAA
jgi:autotransporter passenger strand-loop-strand repeat protein